MRTPAIRSTSTSDTDLATQFARETEPLRDVLMRGARRLTRSSVDAEDLLQDTLLHAYIGFHTFQEGTNLKAWLFRILHNRWISTYRARQSRPSEVPVDEIAEWDSVVRAASAESEVLDSIPAGDIKAAMNSLPEGFRTAVYLADVQGYTYAETAAMLNIPMGTVMSRASRGRKQLRTALAHSAELRIA